MDREHFGARRLQTPGHDRAHALDQLVAEGVIPFAILAQDRAMKKDRLRRHDRPGAEMPDMGREHPRPTQQISGADGLDDDRWAEAHAGFENDAATLDQMKMLRAFAFPQDDLALVEMGRHRAIL